MIKKIEVINVSKYYNLDEGQTRCALHQINLTVEMGEFLGIVGNNGSGKTTLARVMNGLLLPTEGQVLIDGMDTRDRRFHQAIRILTGMVFQNPDNQILSPVVEEEVAFGAENIGCSLEEVNQRVKWALQAVGLSERRYHAPHFLSGGEKQRLAVAASLAMRPSYLFLDEPTSMLDQTGRNEMIRCLHQLHRDYGITIVMVSHCMEDVASCNRLIVLNQGEVHLDGPPWQVFKSPGLEATGLKPPLIARLNYMLASKENQIDPRIVTLRQMMEYLCR